MDAHGELVLLDAARVLLVVVATARDQLLLLARLVHRVARQRTARHGDGVRWLSSRLAVSLANALKNVARLGFV